jgi:hypothetical protein
VKRVRFITAAEAVTGSGFGMGSELAIDFRVITSSGFDMK